jgi:hypothetical protein
MHNLCKNLTLILAAGTAGGLAKALKAWTFSAIGIHALGSGAWYSLGAGRRRAREISTRIGARG